MTGDSYELHHRTAQKRVKKSADIVGFVWLEIKSASSCICFHFMRVVTQNHESNLLLLTDSALRVSLSNQSIDEC